MTWLEACKSDRDVCYSDGGNCLNSMHSVIPVGDYIVEESAVELPGEKWGVLLGHELPI